jgi:hypothetical protein
MRIPELVLFKRGEFRAENASIGRLLLPSIGPATEMFAKRIGNIPLRS